MESCHKRCLRANNREGERKIVFVAFADISETDRMNKGGRGQNKKRCNFQKEIEMLKEELVIEQ